ncbi:MAG TPA: heterodisulfide reductase-related iron-sulfur binding cluster [Myxococcota bacterium]|nr:heterodisulfide reductase-related iron-sulfur binding cluster [Myxococcota bacterium]
MRRLLPLLGLLLPLPALAAEPQREVFRTFGTPSVVAFYALGALTVAAFCFGLYRQYRKYARGRSDARLRPLVPRLLGAARAVLSQETVRRGDPLVGAAHGLVFWGFIVLFIGTGIIALDEDGIQLILGPEAKILTGTFYLVFSLVMDLAGVALIAGLLMMMVRRARSSSPRLDYTRVDSAPSDRSSYAKGDALFLWLLMGIAVTGFLIEGSRIAADQPESAPWSFAGYGLASVSGSLLASEVAFAGFWWVHVLAVFGFIAYLPYSKATHMLTDWVSLASRDERAGIRLPEPAADGSPGIEKLEDFSWRQLLAFDACTKCGRCHEACPARSSKAPLSPRDLVLDLREASNRSFGMTEVFGFSRQPPGDQPLVGGYISAETIWSCTTCRACVEVCPVGVEHVVDIVQMRRALVDRGEVSDLLQEALRGLDEKGNSFGLSPRKRTAWTKALDFKIPDALKAEVDWLWFVGDFASYNPACQEATRSVARVLQAAGLSFGIFYKVEKSAGNDVRRVGEEGLFEVLVEDNVANIEKAGVKKVFTTDPHTLNALKNEYPDMGVRVAHYTTLLLELVRSGALSLEGLRDSRVTYHDPCYLGRYNGIYDDPRELLAACGAELVEMPRNREDSFCCGAGGGRVWMADHDSVDERPSEDRIKEAVALGVDTFVVACPKDMTMYNDAVKTTDNEDNIVVRDIIELVSEALGAPTE